MAIESGDFIDDLVITNPLSGDARTEGDDHIRLIKKVIKATFPNIDGPVTPTPAVLNSLQAQITALDAAKASMPAATQCLFYQAAAPTGWTKITTQDNKALRVVSGSGGVAGGSQPFTTAFASKSVAGVVGSHVLTWNEMPSHTHSYVDVNNAGSVNAGGSWIGSVGNIVTKDSGSAGSNWGHDHTFTGTAINLAVQYIDVIIASRNP